MQSAYAQKIILEKNNWKNKIKTKAWFLEEKEWKRIIQKRICIQKKLTKHIKYVKEFYYMLYWYEFIFHETN